ncbi:hypothetical protein CDN99_18635 [Roseateles aquatilis]|uniref:DUF2987 domain-containing protein n=1 Tax=Roseateles aquatilis TaxID=431061 RepID=A0A246J4T7_9BURK|nr:hypothetical protein [Roseateles aquatilis]OWQ87606.1 hypothetical protein CDN99_18635 [Roseateles aquatilis]
MPFLLPLLLNAASGAFAATAVEPPPAPVAASAPADATLPTVKTDMKRGTFMPYKQLNELLTKLRVHGEGLFVPHFVLTDAKDRTRPPAGVKLALMSDEEYIPIPVDDKGAFDLPVFTAQQAKDMELGSNLPKDSTAIRLSIDLSTSPEMLDMATVRRVVTLGQKLRGELLPWYARWLFPQIDGVIACSDQPLWALDWTEGGQRLRLALPADTQQREPYIAKDKPSRACTVLTGQEQWPDSALLQPPAGGNTKLYVKLRINRPS